MGNLQERCRAIGFNSPANKSVLIEHIYSPKGEEPMAEGYMDQKMKEMAERQLKGDTSAAEMKYENCHTPTTALPGVNALPDSGTRDMFSTGAVRDADASKGRMDLVPMDLIGEILEWDSQTTSDEYCDKSEVARMVFDSLEESVWHQDTKLAMAAFIDFGRYAFGSLEEAILQLSIHFRDGAAKYSERNWQKLIPLHRFIDSAGRHMIKWYRGDQDERHDRSLLWNLICYIWTVRHANIQNKEICDLPWCEELRKNEPEIC